SWRKGASLQEWLTNRARGRREDDLIADPIPVRIVEHADGWGDWHATVNTSGETSGVSDSNVANIKSYVDIMHNSFNNPTFEVPPVGSGGASLKAQRRLALIPVTTDGAGDSPLTVLVPLLASYQACMTLKYIYADATDGDWDMVISPSAGGLLGMTTFASLATTVNVVGPDWGEGLVYQCAADAASIDVTIANGGNVVTYYFVLEYWYET
ncbi:unnamed protein product, partial [marine sediment metagenome]